MNKTTVLITGANGEIGHSLIHHLAEAGHTRLVALDVLPIDETLRRKCHRTVIGDVLDASLMAQLTATHDLNAIYHLAAVLSTKAERQPALAHRVNVDGTLNLLEMAAAQAHQQGRTVRFIFPSSIAVYGLPDLAAKAAAGAVTEDQWCTPRTMYGINKLYGEQLGRYYSRFYRQLDVRAPEGQVDFRALRFPGLISAFTMPTGGTSDFAPEMLHHAAQNQPYACFVRADTRIPFMAMPDAVTAILHLAEAPAETLTRSVYNVGAFNPSAQEVFDLVRQTFPNAQVSFAPDARRQTIVDSWPEAVDDRAARADWGWQPRYTFQTAFADYLFPALR